MAMAVFSFLRIFRPNRHWKAPLLALLSVLIVALLLTVAVVGNLPLYCSPVPPPRGPPGSEWGDASMTSAARTLAFLRDQPEGPRFDLVESAVSGLIFTTAGGSRVLWGRPVEDP